MPVLTSLTPDGWPLPLLVRHAEQTADGFRLRVPVGVEVVDGPVCLTFHGHGEIFDSQENITIIGRSQHAKDGVEFRAERALNDFVMPASLIRRTMYILSARRKLQHRSASEARRRGQQVPRFDQLGV